jgi:hypothetical protein
MFLRFQEEGRDLGRKIEDFETEMEAEMRAYEKGEKTVFLEPGLYIRQLKKWRAIYPPNQFRIYFTDQLASPETASALLSDIQDYLNLPHFSYAHKLEKRYNQAPKAAMPGAVSEKLRSFYQPFNQALADFLSLDLPPSWK